VIRENSSTKKRKRSGLWWKLCLGIVLVLVFAVVLLWFSLPAIVTRVANNKLPGLLHTDVVIGSVELQLIKGSAAVNELRIGQPDGFGEGDLLDVKRLEVQVDLDSLRGDGPLRINGVMIENFDVVVVRNAEDYLNIPRLWRGPIPQNDDVASKPAQEEEITENESANDSDANEPWQGIHIAEVVLENSTLFYRNEVHVDQQPLEFVFNDVTLRLQNLVILPPERGEDAAPVKLTATLDQGKYPPARLELLVELGSIVAGVPELNLQGTLTGLMLDTLGHMVPKGTRAAIGANGADVKCALALSETSINLDGAVVTDANHKYPVKVQGPLGDAKFNIAPVIMGIAGRFTGGARQLASGAFGAATDLGEGVIGGATDLTKGAASAVGKVGGGLFGAVKAIVRRDKDQRREGIQEATKGAFQEASGAVTGARDSVREGANDSRGAVRRSSITDAWLEEIPARHEKDIEAAASALSKMPFPPE